MTTLSPLVEQTPTPPIAAGFGGLKGIYALAFVLTMAGPVIISVSQAIGLPHVWLHPAIVGVFCLSVLPRVASSGKVRNRVRVDGLGALLPIAVLGYAILAYLWSPQPDFARTKAISMLYLCIVPGLALAAASLRSAGSDRRLYELVRASRVVLVVAVLAIVVFGERGSGGRIALGDVNPIWLARGLVMLGIASSARTGRFSFGWSVVVVAACVGIGSRTAALVMLAVMIYSARASLRRVVSSTARFRALWAAASILAAMALTFYMMNSGLLRAADDFSAIARTLLWESAVDQIVLNRSFLIGQGLASFSNPFVVAYGYPHNIVLELLLDVGIFATLATIWAVRRGLRKADEVLKICLVASFALAMTSGDFAGNGAFFAVLIAANAKKMEVGQI